MLLKLENSSKKIHNALQEDLQMVEATSCGGVVIYRGKILTLYKSYKNRYEGWVLPKGTVEEGEEYHETALREVKEEAGVQASIIKYVGKSQYSFNIQNDVVEKDVHWFLMSANSYHSRPQREEYFVDSGYYKFHEAYHLLKFPMNVRFWRWRTTSIWICENLISGETASIFKINVTVQYLHSYEQKCHHRR